MEDDLLAPWPFPHVGQLTEAFAQTVDLFEHPRNRQRRLVELFLGGRTLLIILRSSNGVHSLEEVRPRLRGRDEAVELAVQLLLELVATSRKVRQQTACLPDGDDDGNEVRERGRGVPQDALARPDRIRSSAPCRERSSRCCRSSCI